jgi:uncharacterized protein YceH (UPF0502 family)
VTLRTLSPLEARVLGVLVEKAATVPDSYPLSLNALVLGCNQKTARDPVMAAGEGEVQVALDGLKQLSLVFESSGSRVSRYEHNVGRAIGLPGQSVALLAVLALRGPQTGSELRANCERLHRFADLSSVEGFLDELAERPAEKGGPLVVRLARAPGAREARWAHLLCGEPAVPAAAATPAGGTVDDAVLQLGDLAALRAEQAALREEVRALRELVEHLYRELGVARA